jgi:hypothetical protein
MKKLLFFLFLLLTTYLNSLFCGRIFQKRSFSHTFITPTSTEYERRKSDSENFFKNLLCVLREEGTKKPVPPGQRLFGPSAIIAALKYNTEGEKLIVETGVVGKTIIKQVFYNENTPWTSRVNIDHRYLNFR